MLVAEHGDAEIALGKRVPAAVVARVVCPGVALVQSLHRRREGTVVRLEQEVVVRCQRAGREAADAAARVDKLHFRLEPQVVHLVAEEPLLRLRPRSDVVEARSARPCLTSHTGKITGSAGSPASGSSRQKPKAVPGTAPRCLAPSKERPNRP